VKKLTVVPEEKQTLISKMTGSIKWYNPNKGYGFIQADDEEKDYFVHHTGINVPADDLIEGSKVEFEIKTGDKGPIAFNVNRI
jgi:CspA family cold shock protein